MKRKKTKKHPVVEIFLYSFAVTWLHWSCRSKVAGFIVQSYVTTYIIALKKFDESLLLNVLEHFLTLVDFNH